MTDWGNYEGYQGVARHFPGSPSSPHVKDPRLCLLEALIPDLFRARRVGDIGCNAGAVTVQLALNFDAASVTGVDIDENLIRRARSHLSFRSSRVRPATPETGRAIDYFPISAVLQHGHRSQDLVSRDAMAQAVSSNSGAAAAAASAATTAAAAAAASITTSPPSPWPKVTFFCEDWVVSENPATSGPFDVLLALSVVKWIHLEHLDEGLEAFFRKCASSLVPGGCLVLELQPWRSYEKAVGPKKSPHFRENLKRIKHRPETSFPKLLEQHGLFHLVTSEELPRRISVYRKK